MISMLKSDADQWIEDSIQLQAFVKDYYKNLFVIKYTWSEWRQTDITFPKLNDTKIHKLREFINDAEIKRAMCAMKP